MVGTTIAELPAGLWIIFMGICMPLLCLILTTVRFGLFWEAAREAADAACQAQSYLATSPSSSPGAMPQSSSIALAQNTAVNVAALFPGVTINPDDVQCFIIVTPLANTGSPNLSQASTVIGPNTALTTPVDTSQNLYQERVDVSGQLAPMLSVPIVLFGAIPGLNQPLPVKISMVRVFENPQGVYQSPNSSGGGGSATGGGPSAISKSGP